MESQILKDYLNDLINSLTVDTQYRDSVIDQIILDISNRLNNLDLDEDGEILISHLMSLLDTDIEEDVDFNKDFIMFLIGADSVSEYIEELNMKHKEESYDD